MLFNSPIFLFLFLPLTLAGFFLLARLFGRNAALGFLLLACLLFYAYSSPFNFAVFLVSVIANFLLGYAIAQFRQSSRVWLIGGIILNLGLIGYFKYAGFLVSGLNDIFSASFVVPHIVLPVGISFYTFEQISYLVETRQSGRAEPSLMRYALFVSFFPHLIAGPIIRPHQLLPQFSNPALGRFDWQNFAIGTTFLLFGLFKKVILADGIRRLCIAGVHGGGERRDARRSQRLDRRARLHLPDLFRLLRLFRHGDRARPDVRHRAAAEFRLAVQGASASSISGGAGT